MYLISLAEWAPIRGDWGGGFNKRAVALALAASVPEVVAAGIASDGRHCFLVLDVGPNEIAATLSQLADSFVDEWRVEISTFLPASQAVLAPSPGERSGGMSLARSGISNEPLAMEDDSPGNGTN
jgi:hypothetical protein